MLDAVAPPKSEFPVQRSSLPRKFNQLLRPASYKSFYGGRGGAKSESFARVLVAQAHHEKHLILCTREFQNSIADSVHRDIQHAITQQGLAQWFNVTQNTVRSRLTGSEFIYKGLQKNVQEIKSMKGVTRCWVEEAQSMSPDSWLYLDPTVRAEGSEVWFSWNPLHETDVVYDITVKHPLPGMLAQEVSWRDNPWFPERLEKQRLHMLQADPDAYDWVWEGHPRKISNATVFRGRFVVEGFETPLEVKRFFFGADWGFSNDPTVLVRCWIRDNGDGSEDLMVDHEAYAVGVEIDDTPALFAGGMAEKTGIEYEGIPGAKEWPIKADSARPETISYVRRKGFNIDAAAKWSGSVEDGVAHLKGFRKIVVHQRCQFTAQEMRLYSYKTDPKTLDAEGHPVVLPIIIDKHNHTIDSLRYALDGYIQNRGGLGTWAKLAGMR